MTRNWRLKKAFPWRLYHRIFFADFWPKAFVVSTSKINLEAAAEQNKNLRTFLMIYSQRSRMQCLSFTHYILMQVQHWVNIQFGALILKGSLHWDGRWWTVRTMWTMRSPSKPQRLWDKKGLPRRLSGVWGSMLEPKKSPHLPHFSTSAATHGFHVPAWWATTHVGSERTLLQTHTLCLSPL